MSKKNKLTVKRLREIVKELELVKIECDYIFIPLNPEEPVQYFSKVN